METITLSENNLKTLCDLTTEAHTRIQQDFENINPVVGVSKKMRDIGVPADAMTIDCLKTRKRIIIILHDQDPVNLNYQLCFMDKDPEDEFQKLQFDKLSTQLLYDWIKDYFQTTP